MNRGSSFGNRRAVGGVPRSPTAELSHAKTDRCQRRGHRRVVPMNAPTAWHEMAPTWFLRNVRHVCDRPRVRSGRYRETVRSETAMPSFSNSPWMRGAPQRQFSVRRRRMRFRTSDSMRGLPGRRRERALHHPGNPRRCHRPTVAGWTNTSASRHLGHTLRRHIQNKRLEARKRQSERERTPS